MTNLVRNANLPLNNTKPYRDGDEEYAGEWFNCPVDFEEVKEKLGVEHEEQIEIADYELPFDVHSDMPLWEINANCRMVLEMEGTPIGNEMKAIQQKWFASFDEFIDHKDEIRYYDVGDGAALAEYLICEENIFGEIPHELQKHIDYHPTETSWKWTTDTFSQRAAYSAISKGVMWYRRNAGLCCQSWQIQ